MSISQRWPQQETGRLIDFEDANVVTPMIEPPRPRLVVTGFKPHPEMEISLIPLGYVSQPQFVGVQVVGCPAFEGNHPMPLIAPVAFSVELDLEGVGGTEGVEVIGASTTERLAAPAPQPTSA